MARRAKSKSERPVRGGKRPAEKSRPSSEVGLAPTNIKMLLGSVLVIIAGFILLSRGSITLAPLLLVLGYCVLVPVSIIYRPKK